MKKIRIEITKENINYINTNNMSVTKFINTLINKFRKENLGEDDNEIKRLCMQQNR